MILLLATIILFLAYAILIVYYWINWISIPSFIDPSVSPAIKISVIIPARNEEDNIRALLESLSYQSYPADLFEVIVVDDHSEDLTARVVGQFPKVKLLRLEGAVVNAQKKKAIESGIAMANGELIVTTDADCVVPVNWLELIAACKASTNAVVIVAPVVLKINNSNADESALDFILTIFQQLDFMILQGITGASVHRQFHSMCNGANLAYEKSAFYGVNGFKDIDEIASGDDMLLMHKILQQYPGRANYLKSDGAIVQTQPMRNWKEFFNQRIRWASKTGYYQDLNIRAVLWIVYLFNLSFLVLLIAGFWNPVFFIYAGGYWILKTIIELPFCISVASFFNRQALAWLLFFFQPLHIFYVIISGFLGQIGKYDWKGRKVK